MRYNRKDSFRFTFKTPIKAAFSIYELNGKEVHSHAGTALMHDLSPSGTKISTNLNLPVDKDSDYPVKIHLQFMLNQSVYEIKAEIIWKKIYFDDYFYGVHFYAGDDIKEEIIQQLKVYVKQV
ncbi:PilZ domain-containing protein [Jeotgalibacillus aurantiacus]|uniref:PilZ domain-containing protein n=1 Tax=Jeotgalibacillus aurantiacus TaxID=2763266 RepID=UPI001D09DA58|nr:PilZ domain-containing protein [Jeotgalibacillus aurantiacus]